ncbi:16S rRNA (guanine(966)-N(2))-methyltransferase RsmD [Natronincola peptidivorans]|uniref:16S rRNA (Guanine(966)-N(2))-methyltransferase RsmD n=2 Tax=Natronincola peptidivorans TaxID=426128 RepID=A0A1H9YC32_9FIRM|nr:16S rRNA (guanine(966)-N(2))-methyltransferase RsmD [Natronincola peptidivorans]
MRIIAGKARGYRLITPKDFKIRPTSDRVKESIFNIIQNYIIDGIVIDLFAGTGSLGLEALSRNAEKVYFVDKDKDSIDIIKQNLSKMNLLAKGEIIHADVISAINNLTEKKVQADIIFMDPPYNKGLGNAALEDIDTSELLAPSGRIIIEHDKSEDMPIEMNKLHQFRRKDYGNTSVSFYKQKEEI